jgi:hypothetical protein
MLSTSFCTLISRIGFNCFFSVDCENQAREETSPVDEHHQDTKVNAERSRRVRRRRSSPW